MVSALLQSDLTDSSIRLIGEIFCQSHVAYTECGLGSEDCDELVSRALKAGFAGAKMAGGGAGGVVAVLGPPDDQNDIYRVAREYAAERNAMPHIFEGSSRGVDAFGIHPLRLRSIQEMP
jgi:L-arabinokinase